MNYNLDDAIHMIGELQYERRQLQQMVASLAAENEELKSQLEKKKSKRKEAGK